MLGKLLDGFFPLAVVDMSTEEGKEIASSLEVSNVAVGQSSKPMIYTVSPSPFDNTKSKLSKVKMAKEKPMMENFSDLVQILLRQQSAVLTERGSSLGLQSPGGGDPSEKAQGRRSSSSSPSLVVEIDEANFDRIVLNNSAVVAVAFTAPWCGHCTKLKPEWDEAASQLAKEDVVLGWLDATANEQLAAKFGVRGYPSIKVFSGGLNKKADMAIDYEGGRTASSIVKQLLLEVDRSGVPKIIPEMTSANVLEENYCGGKSHICVLVALPHILESAASGRHKYLDTLTAVTKDFRGSAFSFVWFEAGSQPELEATLELTFGAPAIVAHSMDKHAYAVMRASFSEKPIASFLRGISTGRQRTVQLPVPKAPTVLPTEPWDGLDGAAIEDELSLEDIMGEEL